jgi:hypothetical protein
MMATIHRFQAEREIRFAHTDARRGIPKITDAVYLHCAKCFEEKPGMRSMEEWARLSVARHAHGIQIWCNRHDFNVCIIAFEWGDPMPACQGCEFCTPSKGAPS